MSINNKNNTDHSEKNGLHSCIFFRRKSAAFAAGTKASLQAFPFEAAIPTGFFNFPLRKFPADN
jgi:hypothetical protein